MNKLYKKYFSGRKNSQGGFLEIVVTIVVIMLLMKYFGFTITGFVNWLKDLFHSIW